MKIAAVCSHEAFLGLALAGVEILMKAESPDEAERLLRRLVENKETGVVLLSSDLAAGLGPLLREIRSRQALPVIVEFPSARGVKTAR